jgi:8-oxo-dGTP pyrophosphatase MutT (NUDIX family)
MPADGLLVIPAATVVIFRRAEIGPPELLMVQRSSAMRFAGGAAVFPGGKVDPADYALAAQLNPNGDLEVAAAQVAAVRETLEETGLVIAVREPISIDEAIAARALLIAEGRLETVLQRYGWTLELDRLTLYAHWCPPHERAFDTRFFVFDLGTGAVDVAVDATENTKLFWASASHALDLAEQGEIAVIFPTHRNLERLAQFASFDEVLADIAAHPVTRVRPGIVERDGEPWRQIPDGHGYPVLGEPMATAKSG